MKIINDIMSDVSKQITKDNIKFKKIKYTDICSKERKKHKYEKIKCAKSKIGIYFFVRKGKVLYIGQSSLRRKNYSKWSMYERIKQHFNRNDTGSILYKLPYENLITDNDTELVVIPLFDIDKNSTQARRKLLFLESYLIGKYRPEYNFFVEEE